MRVRGLVQRSIFRVVLSALLIMESAMILTAGALVTELWPCGIVPYEFSNKQTPTDIGLNDGNKKIFRDNAAIWEKFAGVKFIERTTESSYLQVINDPTVAEADVASVGFKPIGADVTVMRVDFGFFEFTGGAPFLQETMQHELGHVLGFIHEQQRPVID